MKLNILITGASSGIGLELSKSFIEDEHNVVGVSRTIPELTGFLKYYECDLSNNNAIEEVTKSLLNDIDKIDVLINCAGVGISGALEYHTDEETAFIFQVNVIGTMSFTKRIIPLIRKSNRGKIINIGSVAGDITIPFQTVYSMTKAAINSYSEGLRLELLPEKIGVTTVLPGDTRTNFTKNRKQPTVIDDDLYGDRIKNSISKMEQDEQNGDSPQKIVKVVKKLIQKNSMPISVTVGMNYKLLVILNKLLPKRLSQLIVYKMYGK